MWDKLKELWAGVLLAGFAGWVLWHLILLYHFSGKVIIFEDNKVTLIVEMIVTSLVILLGIERFIKSIKK